MRRLPKHQIVLGLVGQVCAGKSAVAEAFRRRGALVWDADKQVHELYERREVVSEVRKLFGLEVLDAKGRIERKALGKVVFAAPEKLKLLTRRVIFPRTRAAAGAAVARFKKSASPVLVLDAPTLFAARQTGPCDRIIFVKAPLKKRTAWAKARGWKVDEIRKRDAIMWAERSKRRRADVILDNSGTLKELDRKVAAVWKKFASV